MGVNLGEIARNGRPLRVLHCLWNGEVGGAERAVYLLVREQLADPAIEPALLFGQPRGPYWERARELGCDVISPGFVDGRGVGDLGRAAAAMRPFDVHHFHSAEPLLMLASARCRKVRRVYTHRGGSTPSPAPRGLRYPVTGVLLRRFFHGFSGNTAHAARFASKRFRVDLDRFRVTYNGLDFTLLDPDRPREEVRAELGLRPGSFVVGTAANLKEWKRIDRLVRAVASLSDPRIVLLVVGQGADRERLEALADQLGVEDQVVFAGLQEQVGNYLQAMDAFCLPSTSLESFGNAAVEAMALGLPTIVFSDSPGLVEHIEPNETGFVVRDQAELARTVRNLADDPAWARQIGARGSAAVRQRYTPAQAARRYRALYASALVRN